MDDNNNIHVHGSGAPDNVPFMTSVARPVRTRSAASPTQSAKRSTAVRAVEPFKAAPPLDAIGDYTRLARGGGGVGATDRRAAADRWRSPWRRSPCTTLSRSCASSSAAASTRSATSWTSAVCPSRSSRARFEAFCGEVAHLRQAFDTARGGAARERLRRLLAEAPLGEVAALRLLGALRPQVAFDSEDELDELELEPVVDAPELPPELEQRFLVAERRLRRAEGRSCRPTRGWSPSSSSATSAWV